MAIKRLFLFLLLFIFSSSFICFNAFAQLDESRKYASYARADGAPMSELRRPGKQHLDWEGVKLDLWQDEIKGSRVQGQSYLSTYGFMEHQWLTKDVIKEGLISEPLNEGTYQADHWLEVELAPYGDELSRFRSISRHTYDPYWNAGMLQDWEAADPGLDQVRSLDERSRQYLWKAAMWNWQETVISSENRPINGVQYTSQIREWYF